MYSFDNIHFGTTGNGNRSLETRLVRRPSGLTDRDWYVFSGEMVRVLNANLALAKAEALEKAADRIGWEHLVEPLRVQAAELRRQAEEK